MFKNKENYRIYKWDVPGYEYTPDGEKLVDEGVNEFIGGSFGSIAEAAEAVESYVKALNSNNNSRNTVIVQDVLNRHQRRRLCQVHLEFYGFAPEREADRAMELETTYTENGEEVCTTNIFFIYHIMKINSFHFF